MQSRYLNDYLRSSATAAKRNRIWLVPGTFPVQENGCLYQTTFMFNPDGEICAEYKKNHLFKAYKDGFVYDESVLFSAGKNEVVACGPCGSSVGFAICFDVRFPAIFSGERGKGAQVYIIPAAFTNTTGKKHWKLLLRARAVENEAYVIGSNLSGDNLFGHSMIVDPDGNILAEDLSGIGTASAEINLESVLSTRKEMPLNLNNEGAYFENIN